MHRIHYPLYPPISLKIQHKFDIAAFEYHRQKVRTVKPVVDNKAPNARMHVQLKLKKLQYEQDRIAAIYKENEVLVQKVAAVARSRGTFDNHNDYEPKSLNKLRRLEALSRLTYGNQTFLRRLLSIHPVHNHAEHEDEFQMYQKYRANIIRYPPNWRDYVEQDKQERRRVREKLRGRPWKQKRPKDGDSKKDSQKKDGSSKDDQSLKPKEELSSEDREKQEELDKRDKDEALKAEEMVKAAEDQRNLKKKWRFSKNKKEILVKY